MLTRFHVLGNFSPAQVSSEWVADSRPHIAEVDEEIDRAWSEASARPGARLFDGPMCRLESLKCQADRLHLRISHTSYKAFFGTNVSHPQWADRYGWPVLANAIGLSCALESADGYLLLGCRNHAVAYYGGRIHPFAGTLEPSQPLDLFAQAKRELHEELSLAGSELDDGMCLGMAEDVSLRQPELIFHLRSTLMRSQIEARLDPGEHSGLVAVSGDLAELESRMRDPLATPICVATMKLWGKSRLNEMR